MIRTFAKKCLLLLRQPYFVLKGTSFAMSSDMTAPSCITNSKIGRHCYVGPCTSINNTNVGDYCSIGPNAVIGLLEHPYSRVALSPQLCPPDAHPERRTILEEDVWVGAGAKIREGVTVGRGAVIGTSALVLRDVPPYSIVVGIPAKVIKKRFGDDRIQLVERSRFWTYPPARARRIIEDMRDFPVE